MFRTEALEHRTDQLRGNVLIALPLSWQVAGYCIAFSMFAVLAFLSLAEYSRIETVAGVIVPDKGLAAIVPLRAGVIGDIRVSNGDLIEKGFTLATVRIDQDLVGGSTTTSLSDEALAKQKKSLSDQVDESANASFAQIEQAWARRRGIESEIKGLTSQVQLQRDLVSSSKADLDNALTILSRGFVSKRDVQLREDTYISRRQQLARLEQEIAQKRATIEEIMQNIAQLRAQANTQSANLEASRAGLDQQSAALKGAQAYVLRSPVAGTISALVVRSGQTVSAEQVLMNVIPANSALQAELNVPSNAIGFLKRGQRVRIAPDAFPYQRFGTIQGRVISISQSAVIQRSADGTPVIFFPVTVSLDQGLVQAYRHDWPVVPGMTLTARITTERQSLLRWLFDPIFAVTRR